jgi:hypothetical protein
MSSSAESLDPILREFNDLDTAADATPRPIPDAILRPLLSRQVLSGQVLVRHRNDLVRILALAEEQLAVCRGQGDSGGLIIALLNRASMLSAMNRHREALPLLQEAHEHAVRHSQNGLAAQGQATLEAIQKGLNKP